MEDNAISLPLGGPVLPPGDAERSRAEALISNLRALLNLAYREMETLLPALRAMFPEREVDEAYGSLIDLRSRLTDLLVKLEQEKEVKP